MDSLTQITLGAAVGELVLGKKIGNRALLWGAIGGTIPDLDVLGNLWMSEIDALAFHRGITHSILFAVAGAWLFGWIPKLYYGSRVHAHPWTRAILFGLGSIFMLGISAGILYLLRHSPLPVLLAGIGLAALLTFYTIRSLWQSSFQRSPAIVSAEYKDWVILFFWAFLTHSILDAFTSYGTQLFYPFSDYRVAFNAIAIVDPIYTIPFLGSLIWAARIAREHPLRLKLVRFGLIWSTAYLLLCVANKYYVNTVFERSFKTAGIEVNRYSTSPAIFSNVLWQGVVESDTSFFLGTYSIFDQKDEVVDFTRIPKPANLETELWESPTMSILRWFSNGYFSLYPLPNGQYRFSDLRYGSIMGDESEVPMEEKFIFSFLLTPEKGGWLVKQTRPEGREMKKVFAALWLRMKGN